MKDVTQLIYDETFKQCRRFTKKVYRELPEDVGYPFIYLGEQFDQPNETRTLYVTVGTSQLTIHVYGLAAKRKQTTDLLHDLKLALRYFRHPNFSVNGITSNILYENPDQTETLVHGILTMDVSYYQDERGN
ncbi:hypothetical protein [Enterococcus avium]|uniref:hypothetical protein n=1 Tax=Enterococcus avium TaxID=33945 RepID=UPI0032E4FDE9